MNNVSVTSLSNTVVVTENDSTTVITVPTVATASIVTEGPQGPMGPQGDNDNAIAYSIALG